MVKLYCDDCGKQVDHFSEKFTLDGYYCDECANKRLQGGEAENKQRLLTRKEIQCENMKSISEMLRWFFIGYFLLIAGFFFYLAMYVIETNPFYAVLMFIAFFLALFCALLFHHLTKPKI